MNSIILDRLSEQRTLDLGDQAKQLLENPALNRAVASLSAMYWEEWKKTAPGDNEARETLYLKAQCLDDVLVALASVMGDGQIVTRTREKARIRPIR